MPVGKDWAPTVLVKRNVLEIKSDSVLIAYAWAILSTHWVVLAFFMSTKRMTLLLGTTEPICWPYFENCWYFRADDGRHLLLIPVAHTLLLTAAATMLARRCIAGYWVAMVTANLFLFGLVSLDFRLGSNEMYLLFWLNGVFLFWRQKRWSIPVLLTGIYFWSGTLKLNREWLSGSILHGHLWLVPQSLTGVACGYVICLEMVLIWGLLARRSWLVAGTLAQLILFHVESASQIHWFFPALMLPVLSWFVLDRLLGSVAEGVSIPALWCGRAPGPTYLLLVLFSLCQLVPYMYRGDRVLTGQGRQFALYLFQARQVCDVKAVIYYKWRAARTLDLQMYSLEPRFVCDPVVYFNRVMNICRADDTGAGRMRVDVMMKVRRTTEKEFRTVIDEKDFCSKGYSYDLLRNNSWLH